MSNSEPKWDWEETPCFETTWAKTKAGYGRKWLGPIGQARRVYHHRYIWEKFNGPIPEGMCVCHHCDNPACIEIKHLFLGTKGDNVRDMHKKGRAPNLKGENHGRAKLTATKVMRIRLDYRKGYNQKVIGKKYDISQGMVSNIVNNKNWKHIL